MARGSKTLALILHCSTKGKKDFMGVELIK
jgi:hypothetical protein